MRKYIITDINNNKYTLEDNKGDQVVISLRFFDLTDMPAIDDHLTFSETLFDKKANEGITDFIFGGLDEVYGRKIPLAQRIDIKKLEANPEILIIEKDDKKTYLKRFYG